MMTLGWLHKLSSLLPWAIGIVIGVAIISVIVRVGFRLLQWRRLLKRDLVCMALTPPAATARSPQATQELFAVIHGFRSARSLKDKVLHRDIVLSLEKLSTREQGIRYIIEVDNRLSTRLHHALTTYLPEIKVTKVQIELPQEDMQVIEFKQTGHYGFPLVAQDSLEEHDPAAYLVNAMTKLESDECMGLQIIITPVRLREASLLAHKILGNEDMLSHLSGHKIPLWSGFKKLIVSTLFKVTDTVGEVYHGSTKQSYQASQREVHDKLQVAKRLRPARTLSAFELELMESMHRKLSQPLFRVTIRAMVMAGSQEANDNRLASIKSSLESYSVPSYQSLHARVSLSSFKKLRQFAYQHRLPALLTRHAMVMSASEIASLYHFPLGNSNQTDNLVTSLSRTLPAPISLKQDKKPDVIIGQNDHHGTSTAIGLTELERERHVYIIGGTGNGKTTMLQYAIVQDMEHGKGLAIVDPHGDMAETILRHVPADRINDVVHFNPDDIRYPIGLNLLELTEGLSGDDIIREKDLITESVVSVFRKIFSDEDSGGHRIEYVLRNTIQTALTVDGATLFTIFDLLNDPKYRRVVIKSLENKDLVNFWRNELGKAGEMQRVKMAAGITAKIGRFLFSASAKRILEQPRSTIDFDDIINSGKILICNFSKGLLGEDTSELFGITVLAKLQLASLRRARIQQSERRPFYLYVDEFQNFATASFVQMLSESRKYKLFLTMAEQSTSQQKDQQLVNIILANVGTVISFRTGNPADERLLLPLFSPYIHESEINNLSAFNFYARFSAVKSQEPLSGHTLLLSSDGSIDVSQRIIDHSRATYGLKAKEEEPPDVSKPVSAPRTMKKQIVSAVKSGKIQDATPTV